MAGMLRSGTDSLASGHLVSVRRKGRAIMRGYCGGLSVFGEREALEDTPIGPGPFNRAPPATQPSCPAPAHR